MSLDFLVDVMRNEELELASANLIRPKWSDANV
jgi:hypothetical protein